MVNSFIQPEEGGDSTGLTLWPDDRASEVLRPVMGTVRLPPGSRVLSEDDGLNVE